MDACSSASLYTRQLPTYIISVFSEVHGGEGGLRDGKNLRERELKNYKALELKQIGLLKGVF